MLISTIIANVIIELIDWKLILDYVYMCRKGANEELRYSIRSTVENLPKGKIWLVGDKPDWYTGDFLKVLQGEDAYENVRNQLISVCKFDKISDNFVLMNDDFFTMKKSDVPNWNGGTLDSKIATFNKYAPENLYVKKLLKINSYLKKQGIKNPIDYELHVPIIMNKNNLAQVINLPYLWRSMYGNKFNIGGEENTDVKIYYGNKLLDKSIPDLESMNFISTTDESFKYLSIWINEKFPNPSKYESPQ